MGPILLCRRAAWKVLSENVTNAHLGPSRGSIWARRDGVAGADPRLPSLGGPDRDLAVDVAKYVRSCQTCQPLRRCQHTKAEHVASFIPPLLKIKKSALIQQQSASINTGEIDFTNDA